MGDSFCFNAQFLISEIDEINHCQMWHVASSTNNRFTDPVVDHRFTRSVVIDSRCGTSRMLGTVHGSRSSRTLPTLCRSDRMWWTVHVCRPDRMFLTVFKSAWMWRALRLSSLTIVCTEVLVPLEYFSLIWRRHHYRLHFILYPALMSSESSLACHTYCDMGHPFI